jgi:hypothetical protein
MFGLKNALWHNPTNAMHSMFATRSNNLETSPIQYVMKVQLLSVAGHILHLTMIALPGHICSLGVAPYAVGGGGWLY